MGIVMEVCVRKVMGILLVLFASRSGAIGLEWDEIRKIKAEIEPVRTAMLENFPAGQSLFEAALDKWSASCFVRMLFEIQKSGELPPEHALESLKSAFNKTEDSRLALTILDHIYKVGTPEAMAVLYMLAQSTKVKELQMRIYYERAYNAAIVGGFTRWLPPPTIQAKIEAAINRRRGLNSKSLNCESLLR